MNAHQVIMDASAAVDIAIDAKTFGAVAGRSAQPVLRNVKLAIAPRSHVLSEPTHGQARVEHSGGPSARMG